MKERLTTGQNKWISRWLACFFFSALLAASDGVAQTVSGIITTYAGSGLAYNCGSFYSAPPNCPYIGGLGFSGDGGPATSALLFNPGGIAVDAAGDLFIADTRNNRIRKVTPDGIISTVAGSGQSGFSGDGGPAVLAALNQPEAVVVDAMGNLFIADWGNERIRKVTAAGVIYTIAGSGRPGFSGDGGPATQAEIWGVHGLALDSVGDLFIADTANSRIREVTPDGLIKTVAGNGTHGFTGDGGPATSASLDYPPGVATDAAGNLFIADSNFHIRKVGPNGVISSIATGINSPTAVTVDASGNLFFSAQTAVWKISPAGLTSLVAGNGRMGAPGFGDGGPATSAHLNAPWGLAVDATGDLFIDERGNSRIRKVTGVASTFEPQLVTHLPTGFYIVEATLAQGELSGFWGLEVLGQTSDGFNLGGGVSAAVPGFGAFYLQTPQTVTATAIAPLLPTTNMTLRLLDSDHQPIITNVGVGSSSLQAPLQPGFYIAEITTDSAAPLNYSIALSADFFSGLDTGGYIGPGIIGFGAFYLPVEQDVSMQMFGRNTYGAIGAGSLVLTLRDANRNVIQQIGP